MVRIVAALEKMLSKYEDAVTAPYRYWTTAVIPNKYIVSIWRLWCLPESFAHILTIRTDTYKHPRGMPVEEGEGDGDQ